MYIRNKKGDFNMSNKKTFLAAVLIMAMLVTVLPGNNFTASAASSTSGGLTLADMPQSLKSSIEWVWTNRMANNGIKSFKNLIFDQIYAGNGTLNFVVRWQSSKNLTLEQRKKITSMISLQINNWTQYLSGYDGWPYDKVTVKVVGWACANASQILDKQADEIVYTDYTTDDLSKTDSSIPAKLPYAPDSLSRFVHYSNPNYSYPGGLDKRFDMYLWGTTNFNGGAGGDWGQRISDDYILSALDLNEAHNIEHEIGHGFGLPDFYEDADRPAGGFPVPTIMWAGNSMTITSWDIWMLRYTWSQLNDDTSRFPARAAITPILGDLNDDKNVDAIDFALLKQYLLDPTVSINRDNADINSDGDINSLDFAQLKLMLLK
jgi:hypothetical protein